MNFVTLVPMARNDGSEISAAELNAILAGLWQSFGGCTIEGDVVGHWVDTRDGKHYVDRSMRVSIACDNSRLADAERAVLEIGRQLGQEAMYFEVRYFDGVRFLTVPK